MDMKIERGIPVPENRERRGAPLSEESKLFLSMKVGDSVLIKEKKYLYRAKKIMSARKMGCIFRKVSGGWRVWRIHKGAVSKAVDSAERKQAGAL